MAWNDRSAMNTQLTSVLVAVESPFGEYDLERFDLDRFGNLVDLLVIDLTPLIKPQFWQRYKDRAIRHPAVRVIETWAELKQLVDGKAWDGWIDELGMSAVARRLRRRMQKSDAIRIRIRLGLLPGDFVIQTDVKARLLARRSQLGLLGLTKSILLFFPRRLVRRTPPPDLVLGSGSYTTRDVAPGVPIIWAHSFDFEKAKNEARAGMVSNGSGTVFLDQNLGYHPDQLHSGLKSPVNADGYYAALLAAFDRIEGVLRYPITIAIHPKSSFHDPITIFGQRPTIRMSTQALIHSSELVVCHASASLSYAVIWRKPVLFMTSDELEKCDYKVHIDEMARILKRPVFNIDRFHEVTEDELESAIKLPVDEDAYSTYEEEFIRSSMSPDGHLWEIFSNGMKLFLDGGLPRD